MDDTIKNFKILKISNRNIWIIWKNEKSIFIGYKCTLYSNGATNYIYRTSEYHEFHENSLTTIIKNIENKNNIKSYHKEINNLVFRFNKLKEDYNDVLADNLLLQKMQKITNYVLKPLYYFDDHINLENGILMEKKISLCEVMIKTNYNILRTIKNTENDIISHKNIDIQNFKDGNYHKILKKLSNKLEKAKNKLELCILIIIYKIILMIESLFPFSFRHGDLKINNILCNDHILFKNLEDLKIYMVDFGHSGVIIKNEMFDILTQTSIFQDYILRNKNYDDITFFIIHLYACTTYFFKNNDEIYDEILKNIILRLYNNKYILDKWQLKSRDPWALYYNNIKFFKNSDNYNENIRIYNFKYAIHENYKEIIEKRICELKYNLNKI